MVRACARAGAHLLSSLSDFKAFLRDNPDGCVGWDYTFRISGWRNAFVEWALANAARAEMDLNNLSEVCLAPFSFSWLIPPRFPRWTFVEST